MIIDVHGHLSAPPELYAHKSLLLSGRGYHLGSAMVSDERLEQASKKHLQLLKDAGTDLQLISPRPFQLMHSERPESIVQNWVQVNNDMIAHAVKLHPEVFRGVAGLPQVAGEPTTNCVAEIDRCIKELDFVGILLNPDPYEGEGVSPPMSDEYWYPIYEKMVELDIPALIHTAACKDPRESYSAHFITEESRTILSMLSSDVFKDFPTLKIIVAHGGGSVPYQIGRWRAHRYRAGHEGVTSFDDSLRQFYFDTVLYNQESLELLFRLVGTDRCMFGTENPGSGSSPDPKSGRMMDDLKPVIEAITALSEQDRKNIFETVAKKVFPKLKDYQPGASS